MKQHLKNFFVGLVILALAIAGLDLIIDNPYSQKLLANYISRLVERETNLSLSFESLNLNLIPIEANLFGLQVLPESTTSKSALVDAVQVKIRVSALSLFFGKPKFSIYIDGLNMRWPPPADFKGFLKETKDHAESPSSEKSWPLETLSLRNGQVLLDFSREKSNSRALIGGLNVDMQFKEAMVFSGKLSVGSSDLMLTSKSYLQSTQFSTEFKMTNDIFSLDELKISDRLFEVLGNLKGTLALGDPNARYVRINGKVDNTLDLHFLEKTLGLKNTHGRIKANSKFFVHIPFNKIKDTEFFADGDAEAIDGYIDGNRIYNSQARFFADNSGVKLKDAKVIIDKTQYALLDGSIGFNPNIDFKFAGRAWGLSLSQIISSFGPKFEAVDFEAYSENIAFSGTGEPFKMDLTAQIDLKDLKFPPLKFERKRFKQLPSCRGNVSLSINPKRISFNDTEALCFIPPSSYEPTPLKTRTLVAPSQAQYASRVQIKDFIDFDDGPNMSVVGKDVNLTLARSFFQVDTGGLADLSAHIYETKKQVFVDASFSAHNTSLESVKLANVDGSLTVTDKTLTWKKLKASNKTLTVNSDSGTLFFDTDILSFDLQAENWDREFTSDVLALLDSKEISKFSLEVNALTGKFEIPIFHLSQGRNSFQAKLKDVHYEKEALLNSVSLSGEQNRDTFQFKSVKGRMGSVLLNADVKYTKRNYRQVFSGDDELETSFTTVKSDSVANDLNAIPFVSKHLEPMKLSGTLALNGKLTGPLSKLSGFFNTTINDGQSSGYPLYPLNFKGFVNNSQLQLFASQPGDNFLGRLDFDFVKPGIPFRWYFNLKQFDLKPFLMPPVLHDARNYAYLTGQWTWAGTLTNWWQSEGSLQLDDLTLAVFPPSQEVAATKALFVKTAEPATILMTKKGWTLKNGRTFKLVGTGTTLEFGLNQSKPPERMGIFLKSSVDLSLLSQLSPMVQSGTGTVAMETTIDGPLDELKVKSHIFHAMAPHATTSALSLLIPEISPIFQEISIDMTYENDALLIQDLSARKGKGKIQVSGLVNLSNKNQGKPSKIKVTLDQVSFDFAVPYLKSVHSIINGDIIIAGNERPFDIAGNIKIARAQTDRFLDIETEAIKEYTSRHVGPGFQETSKPLFNFNLAIEAAKAIAIQSKSLSLTMSSNVVLKGNSDKPLLSGNVVVDKGRFRYKRDFIMSRGEMIFDNPLRNDPKIDITAAAQIGTYTITIFISGNASKPLVDILVDPPTKEDGNLISRLDAIVLLSTGRLPESAIGQSQDARNVVVTTGLNLYATQIPFDKFNELTGQKYISPYVNYTTDDQGNPVPQLNVPLHITDLIEAVVQQIPNRTSATIQVPLHDNISLSGSAISTQRNTDTAQADSSTQSGLDLKFVFPFK